MASTNITINYGTNENTIYHEKTGTCWDDVISTLGETIECDCQRHVDHGECDCAPTYVNRIEVSSDEWYVYAAVVRRNEDAPLKIEYEINARLKSSDIEVCTFAEADLSDMTGAWLHAPTNGDMELVRIAIASIDPNAPEVEDIHEPGVEEAKSRLLDHYSRTVTADSEDTITIKDDYNIDSPTLLYACTGARCAVVSCDMTDAVVQFLKSVKKITIDADYHECTPAHIHTIQSAGGVVIDRTSAPTS